MNSRAFSAAVEAAKGEEIKETAALIIRDRALQSVLACWPNVHRITPVMTDATDLATLWTEATVDESDLVDLSGLAPGIALAAYRRAKGNRLIYPDGSVHQFARAILQQLIKDLIMPKGKR